MGNEDLTLIDILSKVEERFRDNRMGSRTMKITPKELLELLNDHEITIEDVIDCHIWSAGLVGVGVITLRDELDLIMETKLTEAIHGS